MPTSKLILIPSSLILCFLLTNGCYEKQEGCLDIIATNFDYGADLPCEDCCTYPKLEIVFDHIYDTVSLNLDSFYYLDNGHVFQFREVQFLLSHIVLKNSNNESVTIDATIAVLDYEEGGAERIVSDNMIRVEIPAFRYSVGQFTELAQYDSLLFNVGFPERWVYNGDDEEHILNPTDDNLFINETDGFIHGRFIIETDTSLNHIDTFDLAGLPFEKMVKIPLEEEFAGGKNFTLEVQADYYKWLKNIDFEAQSKIEIINKMKENTQDVFSSF